MRLYDYLDLRFQELRNAVSQNLQEPPEDPMSGLFYFNTDTKRWYIFDGEKWVDCTLQLIDFSCTITGITYNPETGEFSLDEGYVIPTIQQFQDLWDAIATETQARIDADTILQNNIDAEELARINADTVLQENIDAEEQARIDADNILQGNIDAEEQARINADSTLQDNIDAEATTRENADTALGNRITNEIQAEAQARQQADTNLGNRITNEVGAEATARQQADTALSGRIDNINSLIPTEATSINKLADKEFVINNIQTSSANFRGSWATWSAVPTNANSYPVDVDGNRTPTKNDYMIVLADETRDGGTWRYKYTGIWNINGKQGWKAEYEIEKTPFTPEQQAAIDSGINSTLVGQITTNENDISDINNIIDTYGNIVTHNVNEFATAEQGAKADTAVQPADLATVATTGSYNDLTNKPTIGDGTITFVQGDETKGTITVNQVGDTTIYLDRGSEGIKNLDGGSATSVYVLDQILDCGSSQD